MLALGALHFGGGEGFIIFCDDVKGVSFLLDDLFHDVVCAFLVSVAAAAREEFLPFF